MSVKDAILNAKAGMKNNECFKIEEFLNSLLYIDDKKREERIGMHGSAVIQTEDKFCFREQVLSFFFQPNGEQYIEPKLRRIFLEGWSVHEKWQNLFRQANINIGIEQRGYSKKYNLLFTPDAIIKIGNKKYVVEIKSVNNYQFKNMTCHPSGEKQLQLYMHFLSVPNGFVLCENKNTQDIKVFAYAYDYKKVFIYLQRMREVLRYKKDFVYIGKLPDRICSNVACSRASQCNYASACFEKRIPLDKKQYANIKASWEMNKNDSCGN